MNDAPRRRGRPRKFDRDQVLDSAVRTFLTYGYEGASLDALTDAMAINRPSLYSTFGNKHDLFIEAMDRYAATVGKQQIAPLLTEPNICRAIEAFYDAVIGSFTSNDQPAGCLIACVATEVGERDEQVRNKVCQMVTRSEAVIARRLQAAQDEGQVSRQFEPQSIARMILSITQALALRARSGSSRDEMTTLASDFTTLLMTNLSQKPRAVP